MDSSNEEILNVNPCVVYIKEEEKGLVNFVD